MSKNKHFRKQFIEDNVTETVEETIKNQVEEPVNESINFTEEIVNELADETVDETVENSSKETTEEDIVLEVLGIVTGCNLLNVRSKPEPNSEVLTIIPIDSVITISDVNASQDFYKILVGDLEGYCMKKFIKIKE